MGLLPNAGAFEIRVLGPCHGGGGASTILGRVDAAEGYKGGIGDADALALLGNVPNLADPREARQMTARLMALDAKFAPTTGCGSVVSS